MWENASLIKNGVLTVSSTFGGNHRGMSLDKDMITDGVPTSFWHSFDGNPSWVTYSLKNTQTITKVTVGVRPGL